MHYKNYMILGDKMDNTLYQNIHRKGDKPLLIQQKKGEVEYLTFPLLQETGIVKHLFSTRLGGISKGYFASMNLSLNGEEDTSIVLENYKRIAQVLDEPLDHFVKSRQTHTTNVRKVTAGDAGKGVIYPTDYQDVDGLITNVPGLVLSTTYADCVPLFFVDKKHGAIGLSHSGWKGTVNRMGRETLLAMKEAYGTEPEDVCCAIGPSICQSCYQVSEDVANAFLTEFANHGADESLIYKENEEKYRLNLWRANEIVLQEAGVPKEQIQITDLCTCCNSEYLFSHRASGGKRGLLAAFLMLK